MSQRLGAGLQCLQQGRLEEAWRAFSEVIAADPANAMVADAVGGDAKAKISLVLDLLAMAMAFVRPWIAIVIYVLIALLWIIPDRRVEQHLKTTASAK